MFETLSDADIVKALDDLSATLGFKDEVDAERLLDLMRERQTEECVQGIASWLGLPVRINLSYVSKNFTAGDANRFDSKDLSRTDWTGRGVEGIVAQIAIPQRLPMFGTKDLEGYRISVRVSENCHEQAVTFIAVMAHELSHVLLHSLMHPNRESELHTDLVPILLGFSEVVAAGRKVVKTSMEGRTRTERTTTYGYLTDSQFEVARNKVKGTLAGCLSDKNCLFKEALKMRSKLRQARRGVVRFREYLKTVDRHHDTKINGAHASKIVEYHTLNYERAWERGIEELSSGLRETEEFARELIHFTDVTRTRLGRDASRLKLKSEEIDKLIKAIVSDVKLLGKYVSLFHKLRITLQLQRERK